MVDQDSNPNWHCEIIMFWPCALLIVIENARQIGNCKGLNPIGEAVEIITIPVKLIRRKPFWKEIYWL